MSCPLRQFSLTAALIGLLTLPVAAQDTPPGSSTGWGELPGLGDPLAEGSSGAAPAPTAPATVERPDASSTPAEVRLLAGTNSAVAGKTFAAVLEIKHRDGFHTYWRNWGSAGAAPKIDWTLPEGVTASEIDYATPHAITTSGLPGFGYEGTVQHLIHFEIPATASGELQLRGKLDLLVCNNDGCFPLIPAPELALTVPVQPETAANAAAEPEPSPALASALAQQPETVDWPARWTLGGPDLVLTITTPDANTASQLASGTYFSGETSATASRTDLAQPVTVAANDNILTVKAPLSRSAASRGVGDLATWTGLLLENADGSGPAREIVAKKAGGTADSIAPADPANTQSTPEADSVTSAAATTPTLAANPLSLPAILGFALLGGLILNVMPCVFPVLGLKVMGVVSQAGGQRREIVLHGLAYTAGVLLFFWLLAGLLIWLKSSFGLQLGNGFQLQNPLVVYSLVFVLLAVALNLAGVFEIGSALTTTGQGLQHKSGLAGSFFTGSLATIVATPCTAPFLGPALGAAFQLPPAGIFATFTAMGLGLALPFLLLSAFPKLVAALPRPGAWMESLKVFLSFFMFGAAGFLLFTYAGLVQAGSGKFLGRWLPFDAFLAIIIALTLLALAAWIYGRWGQQRRGRPRQIGLLAAALIAIFAVASALPEKAAFDWEAWTPEREAELQASGTPYFIDFTATWCATCQTNKATYVTNPEVARLVSSRGIVMLKADWTDRDDAITQRLLQMNRISVPTNILWHKKLPQPELFPDTWATASTVIERFERVP